MRRREFLTLLGGIIGSWAVWPFAALAQHPAGAGDRRTLSLTAAQRVEIWRRLSKEAVKTSEPAGLNVGEVVPDTMHLLSFAHSLRKKIPAIKPYLYALLHGQVLIVDPSSKKIISIVSE
jgi:hypothetical protein